MRVCASSKASLGFCWPTSAAWMAVAMVSPTAGHCGMRGRHSTSRSWRIESIDACRKLDPRLPATASKGLACHSERRLRPRRFTGPEAFHEVRACVSAELAQAMKSQVARLARSESAALIGKPQFQIDDTRLPEGPRGQRA